MGHNFQVEENSFIFKEYFFSYIMVRGSLEDQHHPHLYPSK